MRHLLINCARTADLDACISLYATADRKAAWAAGTGRLAWMRVYRYMRPRTGKPDGHLISERTFLSFVVRLTNRRSPIVSRVGYEHMLDVCWRTDSSQLFHMLLQYSPFDMCEYPMSDLFHKKSFDSASDVIPTRPDSLPYSGHGPPHIC